MEEKKKADGKKLSTFDSFDCLSDCQYTAKTVLYTNKSSEHSDHTVSRSSYSEVCDHGSGNSSGNGSLDKCMSPVGRLKSAVNKWKLVDSNSYILTVITGGYGIPFKKLPLSVELKNNRSALNAPEFVKGEIDKLSKLGCISEVKRGDAYVINPLTVAENRSGKQRMVLDCRHINPFLHKFKCKFEDSTVARQMFSAHDFLFKFDLKSAYHHIMIFEPHRKYLGFKWHDGNVERYYVFNVLPFGLSTAGYIFTKVMREVVKHWRSLGMKVIMYLGDGLAGDNSFDSAKTASEFIRKSSSDFGFLIAEDKCEWEPRQHITWLGLQWDMEIGKIFVTSDRLNRLLDILSSILKQIAFKRDLFRARFVARITGQIISMQMVLGGICRLKTRELYKCIDMRANWDSLVPLNNAAVAELDFWRLNISALNSTGKDLRDAQVCNFAVYTDASATGYGGYVEARRTAVGSEVDCGVIANDNCESVSTADCCSDMSIENDMNCEVAASERAVDVVLKTVTGKWSESETCKSSTWRELKAVHETIDESVSLLSGQVVELHTDNKNVVSIVKNGSKVPELQKLSCKLYCMCSIHNITLIPSWIPRDQNSVADFLSRCSDCDDWFVNNNIFRALDKLWGPHSVDRFSSDHNAKCKRFNSRFWCRGTEAVDCFTQCWSGEINWCVPPPRLACKTVNKFISEKANGTLVVPVWKSAPYWPLIFDCKSPRYFCKDSLYFQHCKVTETGRASTGIFNSAQRNVDFVALQIRF